MSFALVSTGVDDGLQEDMTTRSMILRSGKIVFWFQFDFVLFA